MLNLGTKKPGSTIFIPFESFKGSDGSPITLTGLALSDVKVYKNGGTTERASTSGFTLLDTDGTDFDAMVGLHGVSIDLSDNTTAGFWSSGGTYHVAIDAVTVDTVVMRFWAATFEVGYVGAFLNTTIAAITSQTVFTLTVGPAEANALVGREIILHAVGSSVQAFSGVVSAYAVTTKQVTLSAAPPFTIAAGDNVSVMSRASVTVLDLGTSSTLISDFRADFERTGGFLELTKTRVLANLDASISSLNNLSALANLFGPPVLEIPDSGSQLYAFTLVVRDGEGKLVDLDANPTPAATNAAGTDRSANLSAVSHPGTGRYTFTYSVSSAATKESLSISVTGAVSAEARYAVWAGAVVDYDEVTMLAAVKAQTDRLTFTVSGKVDANTTHFGGSAGTFAAGRPEVNVSHQGGQAVNAANGRLEVNLTRVNGNTVDSFFPVNLQLLSIDDDGKVTPVDAEGLGYAAALKLLLAFARGDCESTANSDGTFTLSFKDVAGTGEAFSKVFDPATGTRSEPA
jgi:hypothetical protein